MTSFSMPGDVVALPKKKKRSGTSRSTRCRIFLRDGHNCRYYGEDFPPEKLHVDHVLAVARGGANADHNYVTACAKCNQSKWAHPSQRFIENAPHNLREWWRNFLASPTASNRPDETDSAPVTSKSDARVLAAENEMLREALQRERENADQWRRQVEAANRQAAEATASVRELTRALNTFRALPDGEYSQDEKSAQDGQEAHQSSAAGKEAGASENAAQGASRREPRSLLKLLLGLR